MSAQRPHLRHTVYTEDDAHDVSAQRPHLTQQQEVDLERQILPVKPNGRREIQLWKTKQYNRVMR